MIYSSEHPRQPHPEAMTRIANYVLYSEREFLKLHIVYALFPLDIVTDEDRIFVLQNDHLGRFRVVETGGADPPRYSAYSVGLVAISERDREVVRGVNVWKNSMAHFLRNMPEHSIPLAALISECKRPAFVDEDLRIKDALRVDLHERFELFGQADMLYVNYKLSPEETEEIKEGWRLSMERFLILTQLRKVPLSILGSSVAKPPLLKKGIKMLEVIEEDPLKRFVVAESDQHSNVAYVSLALTELERAKEKWRLRLEEELSKPPHERPITALGSVVGKPLALGRNVALADVVKTDPKGRFEMRGEKPQLFVKLRDMTSGSNDTRRGKPSSPIAKSKGVDDWTTVGGTVKQEGVGIEGAKRAAAKDGDSMGADSAGVGSNIGVWGSGKVVADVTRAASDGLISRGAQAAVQKQAPKLVSASTERPTDVTVLHNAAAPPPGFSVMDKVGPPGFDGLSLEGLNSGKNTFWTGQHGWTADSVVDVGSLLPVDARGKALGNKTDNSADLMLSADPIGAEPMGSTFSVFGKEKLGDSFTWENFKDGKDFANLILDDDDDNEVLPSFLKKEKSPAAASVVGNPSLSEVKAKAPEAVILSEWLPVILDGVAPDLISSFSEKLVDEGFISAQDLLDAQALHQLTPDYLRETCGLKLGHFNRLIKGLQALSSS